MRSMNKPETPKPSVPDLLGPIQKALKPLSIREKTKIGEKVGASITTVLNVQRGTGIRGPSYNLVRDLYVLLVVKEWRPKP